LQKEFIRINKDKSGSINKHELETMTHSDLKNNDWGKIIAECDHSGTGVIDFQEFITACINRKKLTNKEEVKTAFKILDYNGDGKISL
jgi:calcium-dependent protein kinase